MALFYALIGCAAMAIMSTSHANSIFLVNETENGV
jgi:hypothetical protein